MKVFLLNEVPMFVAVVAEKEGSEEAAKVALKLDW